MNSPSTTYRSLYWLFLTSCRSLSSCQSFPGYVVVCNREADGRIHRNSIRRLEQADVERFIKIASPWVRTPVHSPSSHKSRYCVAATLKMPVVVNLSFPPPRAWSRNRCFSIWRKTSLNDVTLVVWNDFKRCRTRSWASCWRFRVEELLPAPNWWPCYRRSRRECSWGSISRDEPEVLEPLPRSG